MQTIIDYEQELLEHFIPKMEKYNVLSRRAQTTFQGNKNRPIYRWFKYKESFPASFVEHLFDDYEITAGKVLDPFAGMGNTLFLASSHGLMSDGIELLPIGQTLVELRDIIRHNFKKDDIKTLKSWRRNIPWKHSSIKNEVPEISLTKGAYPKEILKEMEKYLGRISLENKNVRGVLKFALLCVLEQISYTVKDGAMLRWDFRSGRPQFGKTFSKGYIPDFTQAMCNKLENMIEDISRIYRNGFFEPERLTANICLCGGSCLKILPTLISNSYSVIITSPPYCNRYDYTRTYALELAILGLNEQQILDIRQEMLCSTIENREKDLLDINSDYKIPLNIVKQQNLLQAILGFLEAKKMQGDLNNGNIPRMVKGYFDEMACVIFECFRVLQSGSRFFMLNDNVRYSGVTIPVDILLSSIAERLGFIIEKIEVLSDNKGNSSQQMGKFGRNSLRKCMYIWKKPYTKQGDTNEQY